MGMALQPLGLGEADLGLSGAGSSEPMVCFLMLVSSTHHGITVLWGRGTVAGDFLWAVPPPSHLSGLWHLGQAGPAGQGHSSL